MFISERTAVDVIVEFTNLEVLQTEVDSEFIDNLPALFLVVELLNQLFNESLEFSVKGDVGDLADQELLNVGTLVFTTHNATPVEDGAVFE